MCEAHWRQIEMGKRADAVATTVWARDSIVKGGSRYSLFLVPSFWAVV